jgi:cell division protein FtsI/penicillin-binding protein 2
MPLLKRMSSDPVFQRKSLLPDSEIHCRYVFHYRLHRQKPDDLTLLDRITDSDNNTLEEPEPVVHSTVDLSSDLWDVIHSGMNGVYQSNAAFTDIKSSFNMAGKTGTAQENQDKPNHALFIGYAPYDTPEIAMAVRITNGYSAGCSDKR